MMMLQGAKLSLVFGGVDRPRFAADLQNEGEKKKRVRTRRIIAGEQQSDPCDDVRCSRCLFDKVAILYTGKIVEHSGLGEKDTELWTQNNIPGAK